MATLTCTNKGCYKTTSDSLLDPVTNEIICSECGNPIIGISDFTKRAMIGLGKVKTKQTDRTYNVECKKCTRAGQPEEVDGVFVCFNCKTPLNLTTYFQKLLREHKKAKK